MAVIDMPSSTRIASIAWTMDRPAQVNRSQWNGKDQVIADPWHTRYSAEVELAPIVGEVNVLAMRSFLARLKGRVNTFRLVAVENPQIAIGFTPTVNGAHGVGVTTVLATGLPPDTSVLSDGQFVTIGDQLLMLNAPVVTDGGGTANLQLHRPLRALAPNGAAIEARLPTALMALASAESGWSVGPGQLYGVRFAAEERY